MQETSIFANIRNMSTIFKNSKIYRFIVLPLLASVKVYDTTIHKGKQAVEYFQTKEEEEPLFTFKTGVKIYQRDAQVAVVASSVVVAFLAICKIIHIIITWTPPHKPLRV